MRNNRFCLIFCCIALLVAPVLSRAGVDRVNNFRTPADTDILAGAIDFHCHTSPDINVRSLNDLQLVRLAKQAGMRALVLKNHYTMTADRAELAMQEVGGIEVFGGVVLNRSVGGINAEAVRQMVQFEGHRGKVVWLPTVDAENIVGHAAGHRPYVPVVVNGKPVPELAGVFELIAKNDMVFETGHSSPQESLILIAAAKQAGIKKIVVTHAMALGATLNQMKQMAAMGAIIECCWLNYISKPNLATGAKSKGNQQLVNNCANTIKTIGSEHFLISSDMGQKGYPTQPEALHDFMTMLKTGGLNNADINNIARKNPARLLGLDAW